MNRSRTEDLDRQRRLIFARFWALSPSNKIAISGVAIALLSVLVTAIAMIPSFLALGKDSVDPPPLGKLAPKLSPTDGGFPAFPCKDLEKVIECTVTEVPPGVYLAHSPFPGIQHVPNCHAQYDSFLTWVKVKRAIPSGASGFVVNLRPRKGSLVNVRDVIVHSRRMPIKEGVTLQCAGGADSVVRADIDLDAPKPTARYICGDPSQACKKLISNLTYPNTLTLDIEGTTQHHLVEWRVWVELIVDGKRYLLDLGSSIVSAIPSHCPIYDSDRTRKVWVASRSGSSNC